MVKTEIRIYDPYIISVVEKERAKRGDKTRTATAARLITERLTQLESQHTQGLGPDTGVSKEGTAQASITPPPSSPANSNSA